VPPRAPGVAVYDRSITSQPETKCHAAERVALGRRSRVREVPTNSAARCRGARTAGRVGVEGRVRAAGSNEIRVHRRAGERPVERGVVGGSLPPDAIEIALNGM